MATSSRTRPSGKKPSRSPESFDSLAHRNAAAEILQSYEKLSWYSFQRCESLTQTRLYFQNIIAGFTAEDEAALVDWKTDNSPHPAPAEVDGPEPSRKGKERVSSAGGAGDGVAGSSSKGREKGDGGAGAGAGGGGGAKKKRRSREGEE